MKLKTFENTQFGAIRTLEINNEPYFVGKDIAEILGYTNTPKAIRDHIDNEDKLTERIVLSGQNREVVCINESGLYSLILSSKLPVAKQFKRWVTAEVLPTIRKTGGYVNDESLFVDTYLSFADENIKSLFSQTLAVIKQQNEMITEYKPKAEFCDTILNDTSLVSATVLAKDYGLTTQTFNKMLAELKVQYRKGNQWFLYDKYAKEDFMKSRTLHWTKTGNVSVYSCWTQKGREFIYNLLKNNRAALLEKGGRLK